VQSTSSTYTPRFVDALLDELLEELPAVMAVGPRAAGKTTTLGRRAATIVRLDRPAEAAAFAADPDAALRGLQEPVLLDEWQQVPGVLGAVRRAVERDPRPNRFLLAGSVRAGLDNELWPATGRIVRLPMYPLTVRELRARTGRSTMFEQLAAGDVPDAPHDTPDLRGYVELALTSGFPVPALRLTDEPRRRWLESYLDDLLTHDVMLLEEPTTRRRDPYRLRRYFEALALNSATVTEHRTLYEAAGITRVTACAYDRLLADLLVVEPAPAWASNRLQRLVRQPKRYLIDPALVASALRVDVHGVMGDGSLLGRVLETFVAAQLRPEAWISKSQPRLHHLRTAQGRHEIDLVAELAGQRVLAFEVKASAAPTAGDARHLAWLRDSVGERFVAGIVLHTGPRAFELDERIVAAPISTLWG
jgi:hypothetical protein